MEFRLAYDDIAVLYVSHYATKTPRSNTSFEKFQVFFHSAPEKSFLFIFLSNFTLKLRHRVKNVDLLVSLCIFLVGGRGTEVLQQI